MNARVEHLDEHDVRRERARVEARVAGRSETGFAAEPHRQVIHVIGRLTESVLGFVGPATDALAKRQLHQTLVYFDDPRDRHLFGRLHPAIERIAVPVGGGPIARWSRVLHVLRRSLRRGPVFAAHLHGVVPYLLGSVVCRGFGKPQLLLFSPHGSKALHSLRWKRGVLLRAALPNLSGARRTQTLTSADYEARMLSPSTRPSVGMIEHPIDTEVLDWPRSEGQSPVVAAVDNADGTAGAMGTARLAVLLAEDDSRVHFEWHGSLDETSRECLSAAGVKLDASRDPTARRTRLSAAWIYVAMGSERGFPHRLAEAMALGLPCVALDTPATRSLLKDGETGFLCRNAEAALFQVANLLDSAELRAQIGGAARDDARVRFRSGRFAESLFDLYHLDVPELTEVVGRRATNLASR